MRIRIIKETKNYVDVQFSGRMRHEAVQVGEVRMQKGNYVDSAFWSWRTKTVMVKTFKDRWTMPMRIKKTRLGHVVSAVLKMNDIEGYLWVTDGWDLPLPVDLFGHPIYDETLLSQ